MTTSDVWSTVEVDEVRFPIFLGRTYEDHVTAWREVAVTVQKNYWKLGAIAVRLERATGGRPGSNGGKSWTAIQKFIKDVGIDRQTFQRYKRTYATFAETRTTSGTRYIHLLPFKHFEVAARFYDVTEDAADVVAEAYDKKWSANELERQLVTRVKQENGPTPLNAKMVDRLLRTTYRRLLRHFSAWPSYALTRVPEMLRRLANHIEYGDIPQDDMPQCLRELTIPDYTDRIDECEEAMA